jgi:hypothetical protein
MAYCRLHYFHGYNWYNDQKISLPSQIDGYFFDKTIIFTSIQFPFWPPTLKNKIIMIKTSQVKLAKCVKNMLSVKSSRILNHLNLLKFRQHQVKPFHSERAYHLIRPHEVKTGITNIHWQHPVIAYLIGGLMTIFTTRLLEMYTIQCKSTGHSPSSEKCIK